MSTCTAGLSPEKKKKKKLIKNEGNGEQSAKHVRIKPHQNHGGRRE